MTPARKADLTPYTAAVTDAAKAFVASLAAVTPDAGLGSVIDASTKRDKLVAAALAFAAAGGAEPSGHALDAVTRDRDEARRQCNEGTHALAAQCAKLLAERDALQSAVNALDAQHGLDCPVTIAPSPQTRVEADALLDTCTCGLTTIGRMQR